MKLNASDGVVQMAKLTKKQQYMLFLLGEYYKIERLRLKKDFLDITISKAIFINLCRESMLVATQKRTLYRKLELLEKKKLVSYELRMLRLTKSGIRQCQAIEKEVAPYLQAIETIAQKKTKAKKGQAIFSTNNNPLCQNQVR